MSNDLCFMPAMEMLARYRDRSLSPVEVTTAILAQIEAADPAINAYVTVTGELAMEHAKRAEQSWQAGIAGDLLGIPISIKDLTATKGIRTTRGSKLYENWIPDSDAVFVERVMDAGAVMLGKTNSPEFGWKGETTNPVSGTTRNPWNLDRTAGGSTGGGAAAVAAGMGPLTQGGDGAGSIRIPSSFCGIYGLKPSLFLVPTFPPSAIPSVAHLGPMTRTVADAALLLNVVAGEDARDRYSWSSNIDYLPLCETRDLQGWRIAWSPNLGYAAVEPEIVEICERQLQVLRDLGADVVEAHPNLPDPWNIINDIWAAAMASMHIDNLAEVASQIDQGRKTVVEYGLSISGAQLARQQNRQAEYYESWRQFMQDYDLFVCPTEPCTAFEAGLDFPPEIAGKAMTYLGWTAFTYPFNLTGFPAATVPAGFAADGLPVGLQLVGRWHDDSSVIAASAAYEAGPPGLTSGRRFSPIPTIIIPEQKTIMRIDRRTLLVSAIAAPVAPRLVSAQDESPPWMILAGNSSGPLGRWGHALVFDPVFHRLLLVGGRDDQGTVRGDLWSFDLGGLSWTALDLSGPKSRAGSAAAASADGTGFYYFGGASDDAVFDDLWWFDFAQAAWREISPEGGTSPAKRSGVKGAIDALGRFVITHGRDGNTPYDDTWAYDPATNSWLDISPEPELRPMARYDHDFLALPASGLLMLTGGCSDDLGPCPQGDLWAFDIYGGWSDVTPSTAPTPRTGSVMAQLGGAIVQVGGMTDLGPESDVWRGYFDGGTIGWQELTLVNHGPMGIDRRWRHAMAASGGEYYVFGGDGVEGALSDLWQFSLDRFTESEHTVDPNSDFDDSGEFDNSDEFDE